jgi:hypothetical protein
MTKPKPPAHTSPLDSTKAVDAFMAKLDHACKAQIQALRSALLAVDPAIADIGQA